MNGTEVSHERDNGIACWLLAVTTLAVLTAVPFLDFLAANTEALPSLPRVGRYYAYALVLGVALSFVQALLLHLVSIPAWRALPMAGAQIVMIFGYHELRAFAVALSPQIGDVPVLIAWVALTVAVTFMTLGVVHTRRSVAAVLLLAAIVAANGARLVVSAAVEQRQKHVVERAQAAEHARVTPNVYWIVLDGYPRADVLAAQFRFDNSQFLDALRGRGFRIQDEALANYPSTLSSIASTLSMRYLFSDKAPVQTVKEPNRYAIVRGRNPVVDRFRAFGYRYIHFSNGYDNATLCGDTVDTCVVGSRGFDEVEVALLSRTPYVDASLTQAKLEAGAESSFMRGSVLDLEAKLGIIREVPAPFFVYAHILMPHPPFRYDKNCQSRTHRPDLTTWAEPQRPDFVAHLECTNRQALSLRID